MLVIRFLRTGKRNQPSFKLVVVEKTRSSTSGRFVEGVGFYNPLTKEKVLKGERIKYWISVGAQPSPTVYNLLISEKIIKGKKISVHKKSKKPASVETAPVAAPAPAAPATDKPVETSKIEQSKEEPKIESPTPEIPKE